MNMNRPYIIFYGPVDCFAGYGGRSRDIVKSIIKSDKYDLEIISCKWGSTPFGALDVNNPEDKEILDRIIPSNQIKKQPDIFIMNTVPNEMQKVGKYNILITAGIETTICDASWIEGCNRADLVLTSSEHAKKVFENSKFEKVDNNTGKVVEVIKLQTKIDTLIEGIDINIYKKLAGVIAEEEPELWKTLDSISENFCFLFVGHFLQGELGQDRKDVGMLIKVFLETFKNKPIQPALILKTNGVNYSILDKERINEKISEVRKTVKGTLPNIYLIHGELSDSEMNMLYNHPKVKTHVSFTKGEGWGRPLLEASISAKPMIVSKWSGQLDFLNEEFIDLIPGEVKQIHPSAVVNNMLIPESSWFTIDYIKAAQAMKEHYSNYSKFLEGAKRQAYRSKTEFNLDKMGEKIVNILDNNIVKFEKIKMPDFTSMKFPTLKKI